MENANKGNKMWMWLVLAAIIIVLIVAFMSQNKTETVDETNNTDNLNGQVVTEEEAEGVEDTTDVSINASAPAAALSYQQALERYKDTRIQLDRTCQASPDKMTFKSGTVVMVDNRAPVDRVVKLGSTFNLKAYGFKLVKLESSTLPATFYVDCDQSQNVSTVLLQS